jgi:molecular chaperone GrpE
VADETPNENPDNTAAEAAASDDQEPTLEEQLAAAIAERDANLDRWHRAEAECENVRKRMRRELEEARKYESLGLSRDILPALDNLQRAIDAAGQTHNLDQLIEGVELVAKQFQDALNKHQVIAIDAVNKPFNSEQHEAMQQVPSADHPPMTVIQELEQGYTLHDRLVRPSKVIVSKAVE